MQGVISICYLGGAIDWFEAKILANAFLIAKANEGLQVEMGQLLPGATIQPDAIGIERLRLQVVECADWRGDPRAIDGQTTFGMTVDGRKGIDAWAVFPLAMGKYRSVKWLFQMKAEYNPLQAGTKGKEARLGNMVKDWDPVAKDEPGVLVVLVLAVFGDRGTVEFCHKAVQDKARAGLEANQAYALWDGELGIAPFFVAHPDFYDFRLAAARMSDCLR
jgi:hypothetical protein